MDEITFNRIVVTLMFIFSVIITLNLDKYNKERDKQNNNENE